jgi:hypothetical protein
MVESPASVQRDRHRLEQLRYARREFWCAGRWILDPVKLCRKSAEVVDGARLRGGGDRGAWQIPVR